MLDRASHTCNLCTEDACFCIFRRKDLWRYRIGLAPFCHGLITWPVYGGGLVPWRMQAQLGRTLRDEEQARDIHRGYAIEHHGDPSGVPVLDDTGFLKKVAVESLQKGGRGCQASAPARRWPFRRRHLRAGAKRAHRQGSDRQVLPIRQPPTNSGSTSTISSAPTTSAGASRHAKAPCSMSSPQNLDNRTKSSLSIRSSQGWD